MPAPAPRVLARAKRSRPTVTLEQQGGLNLRVVAAIHVDPARGVEQVADMAKLRTEFSSARLRPVAAKIFADGVIESRTASHARALHGLP